MNKYRNYVFVLPEDEANRQVANGFVNHHQVTAAQIKVMPPAGGWRVVLQVFVEEYLPALRRSDKAHVVILIDFDGHFVQRRPEVEQAIPGELKSRVIVWGSCDNPEALKRQLQRNFEAIGEALADDCAAETTAIWDHPHLAHNEPDRVRLVQTVRPFVFQR